MGYMSVQEVTTALCRVKLREDMGSAKASFWPTGPGVVQYHIYIQVVGVTVCHVWHAGCKGWQGGGRGARGDRNEL